MGPRVKGVKSRVSVCVLKGPKEGGTREGEGGEGVREEIQGVREVPLSCG